MQRDLDACRAILRTGSRSFSAVSRLLPRRVRDPATALYAYCRVADDSIDEAPFVEDAIAKLRDRLDRAYAKNPIDDPVDRALALVVERIPPSLPHALLEGLSWDAEGRRYETFEDLIEYAARVAGSVGEMMTLLMDRSDAFVLARASDLGVAMQLTNIARDVGEDAAQGRIYLPLSWIREEGTDPDDVARTVRRMLRKADEYYVRSDEGVPMLPPDCRAAIRAARSIYSDIGRVIAQNGFDSVTRRARVTRSRKAWLVARSLVK